MDQNNSQEAGSLVLPLVILLVLFFSALGFGIWAFLGRQDYKNNSDIKAAQVAKVAVAAEDIKKDAAFAISEKSPLKQYSGPSTFGSIVIQYPKTWSAFISESGRINPVDGYFNPDFVPDLNSDVSFALRLQVVNSDYTTVLQSYALSIKTGKTNLFAYSAPKVASVKGSELTGVLDFNKQGTMVILPLRDKTIKIWSEGADHTDDFNSIVLPSLTFSP
jgi:hypothetical protein